MKARVLILASTLLWLVATLLELPLLVIFIVTFGWLWRQQVYLSSLTGKIAGVSYDLLVKADRLWPAKEAQ